MNISPKHSKTKVIASVFTILAMLIAGDSNITSHSIKIIVPEVALLDIEAQTSKDISLLFDSPLEAGEPITSNSDNNLWLNVTSIVTRGESRNITVKINETIPGLDLKVTSINYQGSGYGYWGTPNSELSLNTIEQILVSGIKTGVTSNSYNNGYNLKYDAKLDNTKLSELVSIDNRDITVTYTISN